jgi:hypothetical protein
MLLIIGSGNISDHLKKKISQKKMDYDFVSYRDFTKKYSEIKNYDLYKKIIFLGYNQNSFFFNVFIFYKFIRLLERKKTKSHILFFNTQYTFIHKIDKNYKLLNKITDINAYATYKIICSNILKRCKLNYSEVYLPIVYNIENNQNFFFKYLSSLNNLVIPNNGENLNFFLEINSLTTFLLKWIENKTKLEISEKYFLYSYYENFLNFLYLAYKHQIKNIYKNEFNNSFNLEKKLLFFFLIKKLLKNFIKFFIITFKFKKNDTKSKSNIFGYKKRDINYLYPSYNFLLSFNLDIKRIGKKFKILVI